MVSKEIRSTTHLKTTAQEDPGLDIEQEDENTSEQQQQQAKPSYNKKWLTNFSGNHIKNKAITTIKAVENKLKEKAR